MLRIIFCKNIAVLSIIFGAILCNAQDDDSTAILFNGPVNYRNNNDRRNSATGMSLEMEIRLAQEYSQIENVEDFISRINGVPEGVNLIETSIASRFGDGALERSNAEIPKAANCAPELQPVSLRNSSVPSTALYIPSCTRVPRCGGCCGHASLSCQPTAITLRNFQVIITEYDIVNQLTYKRKEIVPVEEHTKCACKCRTKEEHCNDRQIYLPKECRCACTNVDEEAKCLRNNNTKHWDENLCVCQCRGSTECTTGTYYDHNTCSCKKIRVGAGSGGGIQRRHQDQDRRYFGLHNSDRAQPPVFTVNADDPRRRHREDPE